MSVLDCNPRVLYSKLLNAPTIAPVFSAHQGSAAVNFANRYTSLDSKKGWDAILWLLKTGYKNLSLRHLNQMSE